MMQRGRRILINLLLCGAALTMRSAADSIAALDSCFQQQNYQELQVRLPNLAALFPNNPSILFYQAFLQTNADSALTLYKKMVALAPLSPFVDQALFRIGQYYYFSQEYQKARPYFSALFKKYLHSPLRDDAQYLYCQCVFAQGKDDSARVFLKAFIQNSGQSAYIDQAILDLESMGGITATNESGERQYYSIQVATFRNDEDARNAALKLGRLFSHVEILDQSPGYSSNRAVLIGKFTSEEKAQRYAELYIQPHQIEYKIVARPQP
jgi:hypothetical protein